MPSVSQFDIASSTPGERMLNDAVFGVEPNRHLLYEAVRQYRAGQRRGTHSTKTRGLVSGGGRKPWRQKGTGRARAGSIRILSGREGGRHSVLILVTIPFGCPEKFNGGRCARRCRSGPLRAR